jgi:hypothetical protein
MFNFLVRMLVEAARTISCGEPVESTQKRLIGRSSTTFSVQLIAVGHTLPFYEGHGMPILKC